MSLPWYAEVAPETPLMQGDILVNCPLLEWNGEVAEVNFVDGEMELEREVEAIRSDVVVMTQACDLENRKVSNVLLCPHFSLAEHRTDFEKSSQGNVSQKTWHKHCENIKQGSIWNLAMLNSQDSGNIQMSVRIVDFHNVYTVPRLFLEALQKQVAVPRLRLLPPYREHLSQAFARFFMRVGLPMTIPSKWD